MRRLAPRFASRHEHSAVDGARQPAPKSAYCGTSKTIRAGPSSGQMPRILMKKALQFVRRAQINFPKAEFHRQNPLRQPPEL